MNTVVFERGRWSDVNYQRYVPQPERSFFKSTNIECYSFVSSNRFHSSRVTLSTGLITTSSASYERTYGV